MKAALIVISAVYALVLIVGSVVIFQRREPPLTWVAVRDLPVAQVIKGGEAVPAGRQYYVRRALKKGEAIALGSLAAVPEIYGRENEVAFAVSVARDRIGGSGLNIGEAARLCKERKALEPVIVRLMLCSPDASYCLGLASIASSRASELASFFERGPLPYLQPQSTMPICQ